MDAVAQTVSGQTTGFSTIVPGANYPRPAVITPVLAQVNSQKRSVTLTTTMPNRQPAGHSYRWTTTGLNGTLNNQSVNTIQYTETAASPTVGMCQPNAPESKLRRISNIAAGERSEPAASDKRAVDFNSSLARRSTDLI